MCEFCNIEKGDVEVMVTSEVDISVNGKHFTENALEMYVEHKESGEFNIVSGYYLNDGEPVAVTRIPMLYCPMCGGKLHND